MTIVTRSNAAAKRSLGLASSFGLTVAQPYLLDRLLPKNVTLALGFARLTAAYRGPCMRLRRASDNALADILFDPATQKVTMNSPAKLVADGSMTTLTAFAAGGRCTLVEHYDQSDLRQHPVAMPAASQPDVLIDGAFITKVGSGPLVRYDGVDDGTEYLFARNAPHGQYQDGVCPDNAESPFFADGNYAGYGPVSSCLIAPRYGLVNGGNSIGSGNDDRGKLKTYGIRWAQSDSTLHIDAGFIAYGDTGSSPVSSFRLGKSADNHFYNTSYTTIILLRGESEPVSVSQAMMALR